jgi:outer membrane receptor protein involved in Fe transport
LAWAKRQNTNFHANTALPYFNFIHRGIFVTSSQPKLRAGLTVAFMGVVAVPGNATAQVSPSVDAVTLPADANAPVETGTGITTYVPAFFLESNPTSARDMVGRLPGFVFNGGNASTRGFAGSAGNVLIDGAGASTKSVSLNDVLQRIPVSNVERIEIIRGGAPGIDMQGFPVVANVIRKTAQTTGGAIQTTPSINQLGNVHVQNSRAEISHRTDHFSFDGAISTDSNALGGNGTGGNSHGTQGRYDRLGGLRDFGDFRAPGYEHTYSTNGVAEYRHDWLGTFRVNGSATSNKEALNTVYYAIDPLGVTTLRASPSRSRSQGYEFGADYDGEFYGVRGTLLGLYRRSFPISSSRNTSNGTESGNRSPNGETISRATLRSEITPWLTLQAGAEGALNFRDTKSFLTIGGVAQMLPNANVRVEEKRAEFSGTANIIFWPEFRAELGMKYETSVISQIGDTNRDRAFTFGKPMGILTYDVRDDTQLRLRLERRVGQLDFGSFAASNDPVLDTVTAGNANLEPERAWDYEASIEHHFWSKGAITLSYLRSNVEKINDRIVVITPTAIFDAPGNIGDGTRNRISFDATIPFDRLGLNDFRMTLDFNWNWSELTDPVTGALRGAGGESPFGGNISLIHDIPAWNSSFGIQGIIQPRTSTYLLRELRVEQTLVPRQVIYWSWQALPDFQVRITAENPLRRERVRERMLFTTSRAVADFSGRETLRTASYPVFRLLLRKTF